MSDKTDFEKALEQPVDGEIAQGWRAVAEAEMRLQRAYRVCFSSPEGELVMKDLRSKFQERTSLGWEMNPNRVLANEGQRLVVLYLMAMVEAGRSGGQPGVFELIEQFRR